MEYKRLTKWETENSASVNGGTPINKDIAEAINRLAVFEDLIESDKKISKIMCKTKSFSKYFTNGELMEYKRLTERLENGAVRYNNRHYKCIIYPQNKDDYDEVQQMILRLA